MPPLAFRTKRLISYLWHGKSRYHVHSAFVFDFINQVLRDPNKPTIWLNIEAQRDTLSRNQTPINEATMGAAPTNYSQSTTIAKKVRQTAIKPLYGHLLHRTASCFGAKHILELGTGTGISTMYLATSPAAEQVISLEGNETLSSVAKNASEKLGLQNTEFITGNFNSTLSTALGKMPHIDLAFIDGDHRKAPTLAYYNQLLPHTHNNTVIIFDDITWNAEMWDTWQEIIHRPEVTLSLDFYRMGFIFFRKEFRQPQHLQLYYW